MVHGVCESFFCHFLLIQLRLFFLNKPTSVKSTSAFELQHLKEKNILQSCPQERFPCQAAAYEH